MLHGIAAAAVEVAGAAGVAAALADLLRDLGEIDRVDELAGAGRQLHALVHRVASQAGRLAVTAGGVVANHAVDVGLGFEIERVILPAVTDVAGGAVLPIRRGRDAEAVHHGFLADLLQRDRVEKLPGPVLGAVHLFGGLGVAGEAGFSDLGA